ncbi:MAG: YeeE/YedE family protein [Gracilibacteraceae bacterium]|nr:YeeE/YedE family protein [Gracilibacteraceae bacterium]
MANFSKRKRWSPWAAGALTGLIGAATYTFLGAPLGVSGGYETLCSLIGQALRAPWAEALYFRFVQPPVLGFQLLLLPGILAGAWAAAALSGEFAWRLRPEREWTARFGGGVAFRWLLVFAGAVLMAYGAGLAGGCTSGLAVSGAMQLAPGAFVFIAAVFAGGIMTTMALFGRRRQS